MREISLALFRKSEIGRMMGMTYHNRDRRRRKGPRLQLSAARRPGGTSAAARRLDRGDVDLLHAHHRVKRALCFIAAGGEGLGQHARRDLPGDAPLVFAPAARALLAAIADDGVPVAVSLLLIVGGDLEREGFVVLERGPAVEPDTGDAGDRECDRQHVARLAGWEVTGCAVDGAHRAV